MGGLQLKFRPEDRLLPGIYGLTRSLKANAEILPKLGKGRFYSISLCSNFILISLPNNRRGVNLSYRGRN